MCRLIATRTMLFLRSQNVCENLSLVTVIMVLLWLTLSIGFNWFLSLVTVAALENVDYLHEENMDQVRTVTHSLYLSKEVCI